MSTPPGRLLAANSPPADPLECLERRIEGVIAAFETGGRSSWDEVEAVLMEGYGRLLSLEAMCTRLERELTEPASAAAANGDSAEARGELEEFQSMLAADAARLRQRLGRFKARGLKARGLRARGGLNVHSGLERAG
jgi:hypothetical protein